MKNIKAQHYRASRLATIIMIIFLFSSSQGFTTENPYKDIKVERATSNIIKKFNRFDFLESVVSAADGTLYATQLFQGIIYKIEDGKHSELIDIDGKVVGLTMMDKDNLIVTGADDQDRAIVLQVNVDTGETTTITTIPEAMLLNGVTKLDDHFLLIADSFKGVIWKVDVRDGAASIWLEHELLSSPSLENKSPGANGIKIYKDAAYISNTGKMMLVKVPFAENNSAGTPEVVQENVFIDDFTMDNEGNFFAATHIYDSVVKITPEGKVTIIAQIDQGVSGCTCVTLQDSTSKTLLVSTNGGILKPEPCNVVPAKIVQLKLQ